jgi:hypothetical protein
VYQNSINVFQNCFYSEYFLKVCCEYFSFFTNKKLILFHSWILNQNVYIEVEDIIIELYFPNSLYLRFFRTYRDFFLNRLRMNIFWSLQKYSFFPQKINNPVKTGNWFIVFISGNFFILQKFLEVLSDYEYFLTYCETKYPWIKTESNYAISPEETHL